MKTENNIRQTMTTTDFDTVRAVTYRHNESCEKAAAALSRIEARLNAAVAALEALRTAAEAIVADRRSSYSCTIRSVQALEAAIALSKGSAK